MRRREYKRIWAPSLDKLEKKLEMYKLKGWEKYHDIIESSFGFRVYIREKTYNGIIY